MDGVYFGTAYGPLHMVGRIQADARRPVLLTVLGAFPPRTQKHDLVETFADYSVLVCRYPGMHSTTWADASPIRVATALDEFISMHLKGRRIAAYGISTGCLVTLNLVSPEVRHQVAQEPFLRTIHLDRFIGYSRAFLEREPNNRALAEFLWQVFGISAAELVDRDYRDMRSDRSLPLDVIVGATPPQSDSKIWPSFTSVADRQILLDRSSASLHIAPEGTGHDVEPTPEGRAMVNACLSRVLKSL